jgi:CcmD family protein
VSALPAALPALPLHEAGKYVAAAYVVAFAVVLIYVVIMALRLGRMQRELDDLAARERTHAAAARQETLAEPPLR